MNGLIGDLFRYISHLLAANWYWVALAIAAAILVCFAATQTAKLYTRWRAADGFFKLQPSYQFKAKGKLLANKVLRELYEPSAQHIEELDEGERPGMQLAFLSSYPKAIRATVKANRSQTRGGRRKLNAHRQIRELSEWILVEKLPSFAFFAGDEEDHYAIKLIYNGERTQEEMESLAKIVERVLSAHSVDVLQTKNTSALTLVVHIKEPDNPLTEHPKNADWMDERPAKNPKKLPVAITGDGTKQWDYPTHHTVVLGETGGGKGSVIHAIIRQWAPFVESGIVELIGVDPKAMELKPYREIPGLFKEVTYEADEAAEIIFDLKEQMEARARGLGIDTENYNANRSVDPTPETPWKILIIDEFWDFCSDIGLKSAAYEALNAIGKKGRALGFFIVAATQSVEISEIGNIRKHFVTKICLKQDSLGFNKYMLGEGAAERGFDSTAIPASTPANGYKYAGIGYVKGEDGDPELVRFAYSDDEAIIRLCLNMQQQLEAKRGKKNNQTQQNKQTTRKEEVEEALPGFDDFQW